MLLLTPVAPVGLLSGYGQFAIGHSHTLPAFEVSPSQFTARAPNAFPISLGQERTGIVVTELSRFGKVIAIRPVPMAPTQIDYETTSLGFSMRYVAGMKWSAQGAASPFITWADGTVGPGVPSAPSTWALLTWRSEHPPILLHFSNPASLIAIKTDTGFALEAAGWTGTVRVRLPFGSRSATTSQAADFGKLVGELNVHRELISSEAPKPTSATVTRADNGYLLTVLFDQPGAAVPPAAIAAIEKGLAILRSPIVDNGPSGMPLCATNQLRIFLRAPVPIGPGAPLTFRGGIVAQPTNGQEDRLLAFITGNATSAESFALNTLPPLVTMHTEPITGIGMPFASDGTGSYTASLRAATFVVQGRSAPFIDSIFDGVDWVTWQPPGNSAKERANAAAVLALAGPFCRSIENRAVAAMSNAGIVSASVFDDVRYALYGPGEKPAWCAALYSPIKVLTPGTAASDSQNGFKVFGNVETTEAFDLTIASDQPLVTVSHANVDRTMVIGTGPQTVIRVWPKSFGDWSITFRRSSAGNPIPKGAPSPRYNAARR
ncbi:MAG: hypothetical protein M3R13_10955 [Armatimonadota bacterium]|nr:hypothetical protein [Armatimonadota bacterium]